MVSAKGGRARRNESEDFLAGEIKRADEGNFLASL